MGNRRGWLAALPALCAVCCNVAAAAGLSGQISLVSSPEALHVYGANSGEGLSAKAAVGTLGLSSTPTIAYGDINGDGYQDMIIGAPYHYAATAGAQGGGVYVIYGSAAPSGEIALNYFNGLAIEGETTGGLLGAAVAAADVDGDGYDDIIVGAPNNIANAGTPTQAPLGSVYVIYGGPSLPAVIDLANPSSLAAGTVSAFRSEQISNSFGNTGSQGNSNAPTPGQFGAALAVGDINGDGRPDILIGAPGMPSIHYSATNFGTNGRVYVVYAPSSGRFPATTTSYGSSISGASTVDHLGSAVAAGDVNGDGYDDLIIGAATANSAVSTLGAANPPSTDYGGAAYIVYGAAAAFGGVDLANTTAGVVVMRGVAAKDNLGWSVAAGDINGDGYADAAISAPFADPQSAASDNRGAVYMIHGATALASQIDLSNSNNPGVTVIQGRAPAASLGCSVSVGDLNGDGYDDLLLGSPQNGCMKSTDTQPGTLDVLYGNGAVLTAPSTFIDLATTPSDLTVTGKAPGDGMGEIAVVLGDVDGDGYGELGIGLPFAGTFGNGTGEFALLLGGGNAASAARTVMNRSGDIDFASAARARIKTTGGSAVTKSTATLYRGKGAIASSLGTALNNSASAIAASYWGITSDSGYASATASFHYLDSEVTGINLQSLTLYQAGAVGGPWTAVANSKVDMLRHTVSGTATAPSAGTYYYALAGTTPTAAPTVVTVSPAPNQTNVPIGSAISVTFSAAMDPSTLNSATFAVNNGTRGTITCDTPCRTATFTPQGPLTPGFSYTATLTTGVTDSQGNALAVSHTWQFAAAGNTPLISPAAGGGGGGGGGSLGVLEVALGLTALGLFGASARAPPRRRAGTASEKRD